MEKWTENYLFTEVIAKSVFLVSNIQAFAILAVGRVLQSSLAQATATDKQQIF